MSSYYEPFFEGGTNTTSTAAVAQTSVPNYSLPTSTPPVATPQPQTFTETRADGSVWQVTVIHNADGTTNRSETQISGPTGGQAAQVTAPATTPASTPAAAPAATTAATSVTDAPPNSWSADETEAKYDDSGFPVALVYKYTANGHKKGDVAQNFSGIQTRLDSVGAPPELDKSQITDLEGSAPYQGIDSIIAMLKDPKTTVQDYDASFGILARSMGLGPNATSADYYNFMQSLFNGMNSAQETYSAGAKNPMGMLTSTDQQYLGGLRQEAEAGLRKSLDAIMSGSVNNSSNMAILTSNEIVRGMTNDQLKASMELANMHLSAAFNDWQGQATQYNEMFKNGQASAQSIVQAFQNNRLSALQAYSMELDSIYKDNQTYLQEYSADLDRWKANADSILTSIQVEIGLDKYVMDKAKASWEEAYTKHEAEVKQAMDMAQGFGGVFQMAVGVVTILGGLSLMVLNPVVGGGLLAAGATAIGYGGTAALTGFTGALA